MRPVAGAGALAMAGAPRAARSPTDARTRPRRCRNPAGRLWRRRQAAGRRRPGRAGQARSGYRGVFRHQDRLRPLPAAASDEPAGARDPAVLPAPRRLRAVGSPGRGDRLLPADVRAGVPAELADVVQLGHQARADVLVLPCRFAARRTGLVGRGGQPGWSPQGCRLRLPRAMASRCRGIPGVAGQHRRGRAPDAQPQPGELGA